MKKNLLIVAMFISFISSAQIGIGTINPTASLDINGNLRIRGVSEETNMKVAEDSVLVISRDGNVNRIASKKIIESALKTAVKGSFSTSGNIVLTLLSNEALLSFDEEEFDLYDEYDTSTHTFTAKQDGIYEVYTQIKASSGVSAAVNFGVSILKNNTAVSQNNFANISVLSINVTPPIRDSKTLLQLNEGDTVTFKLNSNLATVSLLCNNIDSYFSIVQIR